jgi:pyruvate kinase
MDRKAKIVATLGPTSATEEAIRDLVAAGMDVARLNFSHGTYDEHAARINIIRKIAHETGKPIAILQDLQGPKMRVGNLPAEGVNLTANQIIFLAPEDEISNLVLESPNKLMIPFDVPNLISKKITLRLVLFLEESSNPIKASIYLASLWIFPVLLRKIKQIWILVCSNVWTL